MYPNEAKDLAHAGGHHTYDREKGYQSAEYVHQEYPKVMEGGTIVHSKEEEDAFLGKKKAADKAE
jgi:hypothetical protein